MVQEAEEEVLMEETEVQADNRFSMAQSLVVEAVVVSVPEIQGAPVLQVHQVLRRVDQFQISREEVHPAVPVVVPQARADAVGEVSEERAARQ